MLRFLRAIKKLFVHLIEAFRKCFNSARRLWIYSQRNNIAARYFRDHKIYKLHLGGGYTALEGWLNSDLFPRNPGTVALDAAKPFFFKSGIFDYIFCEHLIEHLNYQQACHMLKECFRALKPGGRIRVCTPDLRAYISLFAPSKTGIQKQHLEWLGNNWLERQGTQQKTEVFALNLLMHAWGHRFLYDFQTLKESLENAGFKDIVRYSPRESNDDNLKYVERHGDGIKAIKAIKKQFGSEIDNEMNDYGSFSVEARKES